MPVPSCVAVLIVEDEPRIRELVVDFLRAEGFQVYAAREPEEAVAVVTSLPQPLLILADAVTSSRQSAALITSLRPEDKLATLPMVVVSEPGPTGDDTWRHVKKPIELDVLLVIVTEFCQRRT